MPACSHTLSRQQVVETERRAWVSRAGGGNELGGTRGLDFYTQRTAVQGNGPLLHQQFGILQHQADFSGGVVEVTFPWPDHGDDFSAEGAAGLEHQRLRRREATECDGGIQFDSGDPGCGSQQDVIYSTHTQLEHRGDPCLNVFSGEGG